MEGICLIRLEGDLCVTSAAELKSILQEALASESGIELNLEGAGEIGVTTWQLLWAAGREAGRKGTTIAIRAPEAVSRAARDAGFEAFEGLADHGEPWPK
jgi:anti-anti-sigma regulatory factor